MTLARAKASPTKAFFVRMLTRDITLDDCILDLVDNSIDSAWKTIGPKASELTRTDELSRFAIHIELTPDEFKIVDNCGGITLDDAVKYAFTFGRDEREDTPDAYAVGVYGIGMKRAMFKIGNRIGVHSTVVEGGHRSSFVVPINVPTWLRDHEQWDFDIEEAVDLPAPGVEIKISDLWPDVADIFRDQTYVKNLRQLLARDYMLPLLHGLTISVNGVNVVGSAPELRAGADFQPLRDSYDDENVHVEMLAGMAFPPPEDDGLEDGDNDTASGWYVFCNGRAVLTADTTVVTGWGLNIPKWHGQYSGFVGLILFSAPNPLDLPMTTTKRSVDASSGVYRRARERMMTAARGWIDYTNQRKYDLDAARQRERSASRVSVTDVEPSPAVVLPKLVKPSGPRIQVANINYSKPLQELRSLASALGNVNHTYRDVGILSFDYAYKMLVDEGE